MPTNRPRIQVTVDDELERVLASATRPGVSRASIVRELAIKGGAAVAAERAAARDARALLIAIADGDGDYDLTAAAALHAARADRLP